MKKSENFILECVKEITKHCEGGVEFFDAFDEKMKDAPIEIFEALLDLVPENYFIAISGGFGEKLSQLIESGEIEERSYMLFNGGIRNGSKPRILRSKMCSQSFEKGIFLDDSIYGGKTYRDIKSAYPGIVSCAVIYDGAPVKKKDIESLFRYYDHFKPEPNFKFS